MVELPSVSTGSFRVRKWILDVLIALCAFASSILAALKSADIGVRTSDWLPTLVVSATVLIVMVLRAAKTRQDEQRYEPVEQPKEVLGAARGVHKSLADKLGLKPENLGVRVLIYKVTWDKHRSNPIELEQIIQYVGGEGGPPGRRMSARCGIAGRAARLAAIQLSARTSADHDAFRKELIEHWGFTRREAHAISLDRFSWMAFPLLQRSGDEPYGVIYLDCTRPDLFQREDVCDNIVNSCKIVASQFEVTYAR